MHDNSTTNVYIKEVPMDKDDKNLIVQLLAIKNNNYFSWKILCDNIGISRSTLHKLITTNEFPRLSTMRKIKTFVDNHLTLGKQVQQ